MTEFITRVVIFVVMPLCIALATLGMIVGQTFKSEVIAYVGLNDSQQMSSVHLLDLRTYIDLNLTPDLQPTFTPQWSPDGKRLLFLTIFGQFQRLVVMQSDGSHLRYISPFSERNLPLLEPRWISNGQIVYIQVEAGQQQVYVLDSLVYNLPDRLDTEDPRYQEYVAQIERDAGQVAFENGQAASIAIELVGNQWSIILRNDGERRVLRNLTNLSVQSGSVLVWSPDRERIIFADEVNSVLELFIMDTNGTNVRRLTYGGGNSPVWRP